MSNSINADTPPRGWDAEPMSRRSMLAAATGISATLIGSRLARAEHAPDHHADHGPAPHQALIDAALDCVKRGELCVNHCIASLGAGDTSLRDCLRSVSTMLPVCATLVRLAALDAKRLKEYAKVCADVCADCEEECKKHQDRHEACKACAQSCAALVEECEKLA